MYGKRQISLTLRRFWNFLKLFLRNRRGLLGLSIIVFFCLTAIFAPLITPYTDLGEDPRTAFLPLAQSHAAPTWLRHLPPYLGGNPNLTEFMSVIESPGSPKLFGEAGGELRAAGNLEDVTIQPSTKNFKGSADGSLAVTYKQNQNTQNATTTLYKEFQFPYSGPPGRFQGTILLFVNGTTTGNNNLKVPVKVEVFIETQGQKWKIFPPPGARLVRGLGGEMYWKPERIPEGFTRAKTGTEVYISRATSAWISSVTFSGDEISSFYIDSQSGELRRIFTQEYGLEVAPIAYTIFSNNPGNYSYGIDITFINEGNANQAETTVYIDEFGLVLYGSSFGLLGTDTQARDIFSQLVYGTRISLYVGLMAAVLSVSIGLVFGLVAGYIGGFVDEGLMRFNDFLLVIPTLPLLMVLVTVLGTTVELLILLMGLLGWNGFARLVRSQVLSIRERPFIEATKAAGAGTGYIIVRHLIPNVMPLVYVTLATSVPGAIVAEAALSWLGFFDPNRMSWGRMLRDFTEAGVRQNWWWVVPPGLAISLLAVSFILLGFALDEVLNPRLRERR